MTAVIAIKAGKSGSDSLTNRRFRPGQVPRLGSEIGARWSRRVADVVARTSTAVRPSQRESMTSTSAAPRPIDTSYSGSENGERSRACLPGRVLDDRGLQGRSGGRSEIEQRAQRSGRTKCVTGAPQDRGTGRDPRSEGPQQGRLPDPRFAGHGAQLACAASPYPAQFGLQGQQRFFAFQQHDADYPPGGGTIDDGGEPGRATFRPPPPPEPSRGT